MRLVLAGVTLAVVCTGTSGAQQIRKSQHATVSQTIATTTVTVVYNRPSARGRRLFGGIVAYGRAWDPGADQATTIAFSTNVLVAGRPLAAGKYSLWAIPQPREWTVIFSKAADTFHVPYPEGHDALRIAVKPEAGPYMETLAFYFPMVDADSAVLRLHWGETVIPIPIVAPASLSETSPPR
ncbi:MAG: hypothetical protein AUH42_00335 [Gemmatimonadetes bacterium 13_1_40CM_70_11]|nr:MAG: hypothetical protein AUH42_00335 [Gemmatimonadetes bacterium 13_1_40CM_70_11]